MRKAAILLMLALVGAGSGSVTAGTVLEQLRSTKGAPASRHMRQRLDQYLKYLKATPKELEELQKLTLEERRKLDPADGIYMMERNPFMRSRLELVAVLSTKDREALLNGETYFSPPYRTLPKDVQALVDSGIGTRQLDPAVRSEIRYRLQIRQEEGAEQLMISPFTPDGRSHPGGGGVLPGVKPVPEA